MGKDKRFRPDVPKPVKKKKFMPHIADDEHVYAVGKAVTDEEEFTDLSNFYLLS